MILYTSEFCPFCHSCRLVLSAKRLDYEEVPLDLTQKADFPEKLSPYRYVPVLVHDEQRVFESTIINEYLDDVFPARALMPADPVQKAQVRFWVNFVQDRLVSAYFNLMNSNDPSEWPGLKDKLDRWFRFAEDRAFANVWTSGDHMSLADMSLYPWIERFVSAERYRGASIPEDCVKLLAWIDAMRATAAVEDCAKPRQAYVDFFDRYWTPLETSN
jgi:glutathione S-transferase